jgi:hypothetical protein
MVDGVSAGRAGNDLGDATNRVTLELAELKPDDVVLFPRAAVSGLRLG